MEERRDIIPMKKPHQAKEFLYFGRKLAKQIREFAVSERAKYEPQAYYTERATDWICSEAVGAEYSPHGTATRARDQDKNRKPKPPVESRLVYSNELKLRYWKDQDDEQSSNFGLSHLGVKSQDVENWLDQPDYHSINFGDAIKILMMEASAAAPAISALDADGAGLEKKRENMETLLLMANNSQISIQSYRNNYVTWTSLWS